MRSSARSSSNPPEPLPMIGNATEAKPSRRTISMADRTLPRIDPSDARQSMSMPATWMMPRKGSRPAPVRTAEPRGMGPCLPPPGTERSATLLDRARHTLGKQEPPRNDVPVPGVDDRFDGLVEEVSGDDAHRDENA